MSIQIRKVSPNGKIKEIDLQSLKDDTCGTDFDTRDTLVFAVKVVGCGEDVNAYSELNGKIVQLIQTECFKQGEHFAAFQVYDKYDCTYYTELYVTKFNNLVDAYIKEILFVLYTICPHNAFSCHFDFLNGAACLKTWLEGGDVSFIYSNCNILLSAIYDILRSAESE